MCAPRQWQSACLQAAHVTLPQYHAMVALSRCGPGFGGRAGKPKKCAQECKKSCPVVRMGARHPPFESLPTVAPSAACACGCRMAGPARPCQKGLNVSRSTGRVARAGTDAREVVSVRRAALAALRAGKLCIEVSKTSKIAWLSEELCIGCGICVKKCPFDAISIINLPKSLESQTTHRYGPNSFKLHRLPLPRPGQVLGLVGSNGTGKSTALKILAGKLKPNLGQFETPPDWEEILKYFRGSELQNYFTRVLEDDLKAIIKPQYVDHIPRAVKGQVGEILRKKDERNVYEARDGQASMLDILDLNDVQERNVEDLSGGELQRFAIGVVVVQEVGARARTLSTRPLDPAPPPKPTSWVHRGVSEAIIRSGWLQSASHYRRAHRVPWCCAPGSGDERRGSAQCEPAPWPPLDGRHPAQAQIYMFDEPSSYLDVKQRLNAARCIRTLLAPKTFVICVEHDLSVLDYLSDFICCLYGVPGAYGVVTMPFSVREGINIFLAGFIPTENMRFRDEALTFRVAEVDETKGEADKHDRYDYPAMTKTMGTFKLEIQPGKFSDSEIIVLLGQNGTGK